LKNSNIKSTKKERQQIERNDNLKVIEGIGPKIEKLLELNNINNLKELSET
jgi:predicted flap endonuclease-1-like 5' DNA nuclease